MQLAEVGCIVDEGDQGTTAQGMQGHILEIRRRV
jgi:hypothetical protein